MLSLLGNPALTLGAAVVLAAVGCGGAVAASGEATPAPSTSTSTTPPTTPPPTEFKETASCAEVKATCGGEPAVVVTGTSKGLAGLDGARVEFAVRYILEEGIGLDVAHGVALGRTFVRGDAFETCVCVPRNAINYPQIAAVVYAPGSTGLGSRDVVRATFSQRYATEGTEDVTYALGAAPNDLQKEAAVAAMVERTEQITANFTTDGKSLHAGLIADDRPIAPQLATGSDAFAKATLTWTMPGRPSPSEKVALFVDRNSNGKCDLDGSDNGAIVPFSKTLAAPTTWLSGDALRTVCDALRVGVSRE